MSRRWQRIFDENTFIPPHSSRMEVAAGEQDFPFRLHLREVEGFQANASTSEYQVRLSFFDFANRTFFGRSWSSAWIRAKGEKLDLDQIVYFHTPFSDLNVVLSVQLCEKTNGGQVRIVGWTTLNIIHRFSDFLDSSERSALTSVQQSDVFAGTLKCLLFLSHIPQSSPNLRKLGSAKLAFVVSQHRCFTSVINYIPDNTFVGFWEPVPGLVHPKTGSPLANPLRCPPVTGVLVGLNLSMGPYRQKFEQELCYLVARDAIQNSNRTFEQANATSVILERRLHVGVHNGWTYLRKPLIFHLNEPISQRTASLRRNFALKSRLRSSSCLDFRNVAATAMNSILNLSQKVELQDLCEDPGIAVIFVLEFLVEVTGNEQNDKISVQSTAAIGWAAWSPFAPQSEQQQQRSLNGSNNIQLQLTGGPVKNPAEVLLFKNSYFFDEIKKDGSFRPFPISVQFQFMEGSVADQRERKSRDDQLKQLPRSTSQQAQFQTTSDYYQPPPDSLRQQQQRSQATAKLQQPQQQRPPQESTSKKPSRPQTEQPDALSPSMNSSSTSNNEVVSPSVTPAPPTRSGRPPLGVAIQQDTSSMVPYHQQLDATQSSLMQSYFQQQRQMASFNSAGFYPPVAYGQYGVGRFPSYPAVPMLNQYQSFMLPEMRELEVPGFHAPVLALQQMALSGMGISRSAFSVLSTADFPQILSQRGETPELVEVSDRLTSTVNNELNDSLRCNEIILQFMAFARMNPQDHLPRTVFFTFQFYRFPPINTERLLVASDKQPGSTLPSILRRIDNKGSTIEGAPGYQVKFVVDPEFLNPGEHRTFIKFLLENHLHIDVWDADSLMLIGSCMVPLKVACRSGKSAIQSYFELPIVTTELHRSDSALDESNPETTDVHTVLNGRLYLKLANVGYPPAFRHEESAGASKNQAIISQTLYRFGQRGVGFYQKRKFVVKAEPMKYADLNLQSSLMLFNRALGNLNGTNGQSETDEQRKRRLQRMDSFRKLEKISNFAVDKITKEALCRDLQTLKLARSQNKHNAILSALLQAMTTTHSIFPSIGSAEFFEFLLQNPFNEPTMLRVEISSPELRLVSNANEWRYFKQLFNLVTPLDESLVNVETGIDGQPTQRILLRPRENVYVPFRFQSFAAFENPLPLSIQPSAEGRYSLLLKSQTIKVVFKSEKTGNPVALLALEVEPQPQPVHQIFRFHQQEQSFFAKFIRVLLPTAQGIHAVYCSDTHVVCEVNTYSGTAKNQDVFIKAGCGVSPQVKSFSVMLYADQFLTRPVQMWQIFLHAQQKVEVSAVQGQLHKFSILLRGDDSNRMIKLYSSDATELRFEPAEVFLLQAKSVLEVKATFRPLKTGERSLQITAVNVELLTLVKSWLLCASVKEPNITKAFQVKFQTSADQVVTKKIPFQNPYNVKAKFFATSSNELVLTLKEPSIELDALATGTFQLKFLPQARPQIQEVLLFISNERGINEETYGVKVVCTNSNGFLH